VKYPWISNLQTKNNQLVSLYVPLPVFVGGKWLLKVRSVPQFATFCHQMLPSYHLPSKMPHIATICRLLLFYKLFCPKLPLPFP
jgi:hypothetical protein